MGHVANFLTTMLNDRDLKYSTLNLHRSAISAYHPPIEGFQVGQHPLIMRLLKGAFNKKPPQPRYTQTWDVNQVLEEIKRLGPNESLTLKALSLKLAMLLALTTVSRSSELHKLDPILISDKGDHTVQITFIFIGQTHLVFGKRVCTCVTKHSNAFRTFLNWLKNSKRVWHEPKLHILRLPIFAHFDL